MSLNNENFKKEKWHRKSQGTLESLELTTDNVHGLSCLALIQRLSAASDDIQSARQGIRDLLAHNLKTKQKNVGSLAVTTKVE